jgi:hypothetical protein
LTTLFLVTLTACLATGSGVPNPIHDGVFISNVDESVSSNDEYAIKASPSSLPRRSVLQDAVNNNNINNNDDGNSNKQVDTNDNEQHQHHHTAPHRHHNRLANASASNSPRGGDIDDLVINTQSGMVRGKAYYMDHHLPRTSRPRNYPFGRKKYRVNGWTGIPYAEKPVGDLRFKRTVPIKAWDGVYNATELPNACHQIEDTVIGPDFWGVDMWNPNTPMSEDCLYLNVWTPHPRPRNSPVMVKNFYFYFLE